MSDIDTNTDTEVPSVVRLRSSKYDPVFAKARKQRVRKDGTRKPVWFEVGDSQKANYRAAYLRDLDPNDEYEINKRGSRVYITFLGDSA